MKTSRHKKEAVYEEAIERWGVSAMLLKTTEELAELIQAISKYQHYTGEEHLEAMIKELGDAEIMMEQVKVWLKSLSYGYIELLINKKSESLNRVQRMLKEGKNEE